MLPTPEQQDSKTYTYDQLIQKYPNVFKSPEYKKFNSELDKQFNDILWQSKKLPSYMNKKDRIENALQYYTNGLSDIEILQLTNFLNDKVF